MSEATLHLSTRTGSTGFFEVLFTYGSTEHEEAKRQEYRTLGGQLHTYAWRERWAATFHMMRVNSADRFQLTTWWEERTPLIATLALSDSPQQVLCRLVGEREPLQAREDPEATLYRGAIFLVETDGRGKENVDGVPFITDVSATDGPHLTI